MWLIPAFRRARLTAFGRRAAPEPGGEMIWVSADRTDDERTDEPDCAAKAALATDGDGTS